MQRVKEIEFKRAYSIAKDNELKIKQGERNDLLRRRAESMIHLTKHQEANRIPAIIIYLEY